MNCSACGAVNPKGKRYCANCGAALAVECPSCGSVNLPNQKFCGDCGHAMPGVQQPAPQPAREAERRQLTVMFCDLVGSTALANRLDPEDWQNVIRGYHAAVTAAVAPYEGHIAQLLGDGVLVYFGYPRAHEDDAGRAVRAALAVLQAVATLKPQGETALQTRIGIATGVVVVGEIGTGTPAAEQSASGETPNLAARLQAQAEPGQIVLSEQTRHLVGGSFELRSLGRLDLKGFAAPVDAWRVVGEREVASRFEAQHGQRLAAFIGRDSEVALLLERWQLARDGEGQVVLLSGEAGIGKSRICEKLRERLASQTYATVLLQCSPYFSGSALYPLVQHLARTAGLLPADTAEDRARKVQRLALDLAPGALGHVLRLMGLPDGGRSPPDTQTPQQQKAQTLRALIELLLALAGRQPVLYLVEDAHWIDPTTEELVKETIDRVRDAAVLVLVTCRPEYTPTWGSPAQLTRLTLSRLGQRQCAALVGAVAGGKALPAEVLAEIVRKTDGVPLFVEELTKTVLQSGLLQETATGYRIDGPLPALAIPSTLQDSLTARLDRLAPAKEVAQAGAAIGREFSHGLLAAVLPLAPQRLDEALAELVKAELLMRRGIAPEITYTFKHALIRDTAYNSMLKSQRALRHRQIATALQHIEPEAVAAQPELLAHHHQEAGDTRPAIEQWSKAGKLAVARGANREAATAFEHALTLLGSLPETTQTMSDVLDIRIAMGPVLIALHGPASKQAEALYLHAVSLAERLDDGSRLFPALWGLYYGHMYAGRAEAWQLAGRLLDVAERGNDSEHRVEAHHAMWGVAVVTGRPLQALIHLERGEALYDPERHASLRYRYAGHDPGVCCASMRSISTWLLGFPDRALREVVAAQARVNELHHPMTYLFLAWAAWVHYHRGDRAAAAQLGERFMRIVEQYNFHAGFGSAVVLTELAPGSQLTPDRLDQLHRRIVGSASSQPFKGFMSCVLIDLYAAAGEVEGALRVLEPMLGQGADINRAELHRLQGALLLQRAAPDATAAERCFEQAIEVAREQGAKSFELRAATSLASLWQKQGKRDEARRLLGNVYGWFTEGFDTRDLKEARALLDRLAGS